MNDLLRQLAEKVGIESGYEDTWGVWHATSIETQTAILRAMGFSIDTQAELRCALQKLDADATAKPAEDAMPARAWQPPAMAAGGRRWGLAVQLYALRSERNWGIGDFTDLGMLLRGAAELGAAAVGVNPLHALFPTRPQHASPYSPSSRHFVNPLYLDVTAIPQFADCAAAHACAHDPRFKQRLAVAQAAEYVDYAAVARLKWPVLHCLHQQFQTQCDAPEHAARNANFRRFQRAQGPDLQRFALFNALAATQPDIDWHAWPDDFKDPDSHAVAAFAKEHVAEVEFHQYLQWQAALQLEEVNAIARASGMSIGLYADLAVGVDPTGAEAWSDQKLLARGVTIGAPPDALNLSGQNWGTPPPDPVAMIATGFADFSSLLDANMRHAGALRLDHVLALMRLYWIPAGAAAIDGAYVRYPFRRLMARLAEQSQTHQCLVVGEDLGTVPPGLRDALREANVLAYRLLYFEQQAGRFRSPNEYTPEALVAIGTHDLPPLPMWWRGEDIALRERLGLWPSAEVRNQAGVEREHARAALVDALGNVVHASDGVPEAAPVDAVYAYLARTPSKLLMVQFEDVLDVHTQVNVPGTVDEHPNWRARLPCTIEAALAHPAMRRVAAIMADNGRADD